MGNHLSMVMMVPGDTDGGIIIQTWWFWYNPTGSNHPGGAVPAHHGTSNQGYPGGANAGGNPVLDLVVVNLVVVAGHPVT